MLTSLLLPTTAQSDCSIKYQVIDLVIINAQKYEPLVINMVKSRNCHFENKTFILSVKYGTVPYLVQRVASISLNIAGTLHNLQCYVIIMYNSGKLITVFVRKKCSSHSSQRVRWPKLLHIPWLCLHRTQEKWHNFPSYKIFMLTGNIN